MCNRVSSKCSSFMVIEGISFAIFVHSHSLHLKRYFEYFSLKVSENVTRIVHFDEHMSTA